MKNSLKTLLALPIAVTALNAEALPIDWKGTLGFDQNIIKNARRTTDNCTYAAATGGECLDNDNNNARYQSMLLKLQPTIIVNDSTSIKGELSTGTIRGGFLGDNTTSSGSSYFAQSSAGRNSLNINQFYAELYADTALFRVGRFSKDYGLGAITSGGNGKWDRFFSAYDGFEAEFKLGSFKLVAAMAKLDTNTGATEPKAPNGKYDTNESSIVALYDNSNNNLKAGVYYAQREVETNSDLNGAGVGSQNITLIDIFFDKTWGDFNLAMEIPMLSGDVGTAYGATSKQDFDARAYILETSYMLNPKWKIGLNAGMIGGSDGDQSKQEAVYLHPNYQIAEVMFRYNLQGFQNKDENIFSSSIVNTNYAKIFAHYKNDAWGWRLDFIMAKANETAKSGSEYYDHRAKKYITATADQKDDLGMEFDIAFDYEWSPSILVTGYVGYYQVGDYYAFTNTSTELDTTSVTASGFRLNIGF